MAPLCNGAASLSSEGKHKEKEHLERFVFQFLTSWVEEIHLIYLNWVLFCIFYKP